MQRKGGQMWFHDAPTSVITFVSRRAEERCVHRIMEQLGHQSGQRLRIPVTESEINVDLIDFDDPDWPATTARHVDLRLPPLILPGLGP